MMSKRSTLFAAAVAVLVALAGCGSQPAQDDPDRKAGSFSFAAFKGTTRTCGEKKCVVEVNAEVGWFGCAIADITVDADVLELTQPDTTIEWHLKGDFAFCPTRGDGVFITSDDPKFQFREPDPSDDERKSGNGCRKKFRMHGVNDKVPGEYFKYMLRFRSTMQWGTVCERDPFVRNGR